tara:strand:+ start:37478 stop:38677 length:1200 start_codon:yes stop_codon:yes gene_type:complete
MKYAWTMKAKGRYVDSGTQEASSESEALNLVMVDQAFRQDRDADTCYSLTCGSTATTSFGDEFLRSAGASSIDDTMLDSSGHTFAPSLSDVVTGTPTDPATAAADAVRKLAEIVEDEGWSLDLGDSCDRTFEDCKNKFDNLENFTGTNRGAKCAHTLHDPGCGAGQAQVDESYFVATALENGKKGDMIKVRFHDSRSLATALLGSDVAINAGLLAGTDGMLYAYFPSSRTAARGPNLQQLPNPTARGDALRKALEATPVDTGAARKDWAIRGAEAQKAFEESMETDGDFVANVVFPKLTAEELAVQDEVIRLRERLAKSQGIPHDSGEIRKVWINDEQIFPGPRKLGPTVTRIIEAPRVIICQAPHCQEQIQVGHLPKGITSGVPCPGCDATYTFERDF